MSLLTRMIKEEWRMHSLLFGGRNFSLFPFLILLMAVPGYWALLRSGFTPTAIRTGLHYLTLFLGLNVGAIGFVSRDAIKNLLGEANLLVFSSRTLPISQIRLVATFLMKDLVYYSFLFLTPLAAALVPAEMIAGEGIRLPFLLWFTASGMFLVGVAVSFLLASLYNRGRPYLLAGLAGLGWLLWYFNTGILAFTPLELYREPTLDSLLFGFVPAFLLMGLGLVVFTPGIRSSRQTYTERFSHIHTRLRRFDDSGLVSKFLLDMKRTSGGFTKIVFSVGVILAVFIVMAERLFFAQGFLQEPLLSFALILAIASVSVYNWINRFDALKSYQTLPVSIEDVFTAKYITFFLLATPVNLLFLLLAGYRYGYGGSMTALVVLPPMMLYVLGVTAYMTGLEPNQMLLDARTFFVYTLVMGVAFVPLFVWALVNSVAPGVVTAGMTGLCLVFGLIGYRLSMNAPGRWQGG